MNWLKWLCSKRYRQHRWAREHLSEYRIIRQRIRSVELPLRYPAGDPRSMERFGRLLRSIAAIPRDSRN